MLRRPPISQLTDTLCPSTTLFRSRLVGGSDDIHPIAGCQVRVQPPHRRLDHATLWLAREVGNKRCAGLLIRGLAAPDRGQPQVKRGRHPRRAPPQRSEEHTSELQSLMRTSYAVFCLKKINNTTTTIPEKEKQLT